MSVVLLLSQHLQIGMGLDGRQSAVKTLSLVAWL